MSDEITRRLAAGEIPSVAEILAALIEHGRKLEEANKLLVDASEKYGPAENAYRVAKAKAALVAERELRKEGFERPTVDQQRAYVDVHTSDEREEAKCAEAMMLAYREIARGRRGLLSAWQSIASAFREELSFARSGPDV